MCVYQCTLWEDLRALYHLPELLRKNNAPSVILIMAMVSESKGISCWRDQHIHRPHSGLGWLKIYKMFRWLPLTSLQYCKYRVMGLRSTVSSENMDAVKCTSIMIGQTQEKHVRHVIIHSNWELSCCNSNTIWFCTICALCFNKANVLNIKLNITYQTLSNLLINWPT